MLLMATTMVLTACEKDPDPDPQPQPQSENISLSGTTWEGSLNNTFLYQGTLEMVVSFNIIIDFNDTLNGEFFMDMNIEVPQYPSAGQRMNDSWPHTYTFDGKTCTLTYAEGVELDEGEDPTLAVLRYNAADTTFIMPVDDPDAEEMLGTDTVVFHLTRGTLSF